MNRKDISNIKLTIKSKEDKSFPHENFVAGTPPFLRGINSTMFVDKSIENRIYTDISITKENKINTIDDFKNSYDLDVLQTISVAILMDKNLLQNFSFYITTLEEQGIPLNSLKGIFKIDFHTDTSIKYIADILEFTNLKTPKFNSIVFSNESINISETNTETELAYLLTQSINFIKKGINFGLDIDFLASKISFSFISETDTFTEIAKIRSVRMLWAKLIKKFNPKQENSLALHVNAVFNKTDFKQNTLDAFSKKMLKHMSAFFSGTQNVETISKNNPSLLFLENESGITKTVDPWAGSYYLEELTQDISIKTWGIIQNIKQLDDINKAVEENILDISFKEKKKYRETFETNQKDLVNKPKMNRDDSETQITLDNLESCVKTGKGNLLDLTLKCVKKRATLHEITNILQPN